MPEAEADSFYSDETEFIEYQPVLNIRYSPYQPHKTIVLQGHCLVTITGTAEGHRGNVTLIRSEAGDEVVSLNGFLSGNHQYPAGSGCQVLLHYINIAGNLYWACLNPTNPNP